MKSLNTIMFWAIGVTFVAIGILKYLNFDEVSGEVFTRAHFPRWFFYVIATMEMAAGILLLMTATTSKQIGSLMIAFVMLGAVGTRYILGEPFRNLVLPGLIFVLAIMMSVNLLRKKSQ